MPAQPHRVPAVFEMMMKSRQRIEGITFSGGEPFDQARGLASLAGMLKHEGLNIMAYSGYTLTEILGRGNPDQLELLHRVDLLVDGPYQQERQRAHMWKGSANQTIYDFGNILVGADARMNAEAEILIDSNGDVSVTGMLVETARQLSAPPFGESFARTLSVG